jgi:catechol 2,3-dioxygenase-like lactoylglutathione lyase family enzyme
MNGCAWWVPDSPLPSSKSSCRSISSRWHGNLAGRVGVHTESGPGEEQMNLQKIYTALLTADLAAAEGWYTKLLGRGPDSRPMDTLVQWELFEQGGVALSTDSEIAGRGVMFLIVDDVAAERRRLQSLGIVLEDDIEGDYSTLAQVRDPDGNLLTLATPPSRPYPPA